MPTFLFIKNKVVVQTVRDPGQNALETAVRTHAPPAPASTSLGEGPSKDESAASKDVNVLCAFSSCLVINAPPLQVSLLEYLDSTQLNCLNESDTHNIKSILGNKTRNTGKSYLESDSDEQLLINIYVCYTFVPFFYLMHKLTKLINRAVQSVRPHPINRYSHRRRILCSKNYQAIHQSPSTWI